MNLVILIGNITKDFELRKTTNGKSTCSFSLAVQRDREHADFPNCVAWNETADLLHRYCHKGSKVGIIGKLNTRSYQKDGRNVYVTEVLVNSVQFLDPPSEAQNKPQEKQKPVDEDLYGYGIDSEELPF